MQRRQRSKTASRKSTHTSGGVVRRCVVQARGKPPPTALGGAACRRVGRDMKQGVSDCLLVAYALFAFAYLGR